MQILRGFMSNRLFLMCAFCFAFLLISAVGLGQQQAASLTGQVIDSTGAAVPGATVTISDPLRGTKNSTITDERGNYTVPQIPPGDHYEITVTKPGFKETVDRKSTRLNSSHRR